jgi:hypothetical protein
MNMISLPRPTCPYCGEDMRRWPLGQHTLETVEKGLREIGVADGW